MLEKLRKYKFILAFLLFISFLLINNKVNASTNINFEYNGQTYSTVCPVDNITNYVITVDTANNFYLSFTDCNEINICYCITKYEYGRDTTSIRYKYKNGDHATEYRYKLNGLNWVYSNSGWDGYSKYTLKDFVQTTIDVYDANCNNIIHNSDISAVNPFYLEYNESLKSYVVYSQWYGITDNELYAHQHYYQINPSSAPIAFVSNIRDFEGWSNMEGEENFIGPGAEFNEENEKVDMDVEKVRWRVGMQILDYGTYYFCHYLPLSDNKDYEIVKFVITETGEAYTETRNNNSSSWSNKQNITEISTIRDNITNLNSYDNFEVFYTENYSNAFIYTNWFLSDNNYIYKVDYSTDEVNWNDSMNVEEYTSTFDYFRYTLDVVNNGSYYIRLIILNSNDNSIVKTKVIRIDIRNIGVANYDSNDSNVAYALKNNFVYHFFKNSLGALFYPVDILFDFLDRIDKIGTSNPTIVVPTVREYFTGAVIINGFTFSLDDVLENETFANVYTIYLNVVDFILFMALVSYIYNVFKDFTNFGGGII